MATEATVSNKPAGRGPLIVVTMALALLVAGTGALWMHYGTAVFYEMVLAGIAACL